MAGGKGDIIVPAVVPSVDKQMIWADVSPLLQTACNDLKDGVLVHGENFNLFAAMSALEIMDPKMDTGMGEQGYRSIEEAIDAGAAPVPFSSDRTLDVQSTIDVMDHLLACEASWQKGGSLAQTVFSCLYLLKFDRTTPHALLGSYCRIVRTTCSAILSVVSDARTHEEEDLFIMSFGLPLKVEGDDKSLALLNAVEETLCRQLRASKASTSKKKTMEDVDPLQTNSEFEEQYCKAVLCRLRFRKHFYHALLSMRKPQGKGMEMARKHIESCSSQLSLMRDSSEFLMSSANGICQSSIEARTTASGRQPIGFDVNLNSRLLAPTPPRTIKILSWENAIEYFQKLLIDLDTVCSFSLDPNFEEVLRAVVRFQKSQPDLVARAHLQVLLVQDGKLYGRDPFHDIIFRAISLPGLIGSAELQKNEFVMRLGQLLICLLKILCTNTAWQRRKLGKILHDWSIFAGQLDMNCHKGLEVLSVAAVDEGIYKLLTHLFSWTEELIYWIAARFLMLGFELELYSRSEYCMVYWYLYIMFIKLIEKAQFRISQDTETLKRKGKKKKELLKDTQRDVRLPPDLLLLQCKVYLAEGLAMMLAALDNDRQLMKQSNAFSTEQERFLQHFDLLLKARVPDGLSYALFKDSTIHVHFSAVVTYNYFHDVQRISKELRGSFSGDPDKLAELRQIEQVAMHNRIAVDVINQVGPSDPSLQVSFEFNQHPCFALAIVKRV